jgi:5-methyltetrahydrofolate--homocysteine methyltransferase
MRAGAALDASYIQELAKAAPDTNLHLHCERLPNPMGDTGFDETPDVTSRLLHRLPPKDWSIS